jgi:hypothetical protein
MGERMLPRVWDRRKLLWLGGLGAALGLVQRANPVEADDGDPFLLGSDNTAESITRLHGNIDFSPSSPGGGGVVLKVEQESSGVGTLAIHAIGGPGRDAIAGWGGNSPNQNSGGLGVYGQGGTSASGEQGIGVLGNGNPASGDKGGDGVRGSTVSATRAGVFGFNFGTGAGVRGYGAVAGPLPTGNGIGVEGKSGSSGIGVLAENTGAGVGLAVKGRAGFSACGSDTIAAGQASKTVNNAAATAASHITVTLTEDPGSTNTNPPGQGGARAPSPVAQVHWVQRQAGSFTVHLTQGVVNATDFTYLIVEPYSGS